MTTIYRCDNCGAMRENREDFDECVKCKKGVLVKEGHCFCTEDIFGLFGVSLDYITPDPTSPRPNPKNLSDVIPFDSEAAMRRLKEEQRLSEIALIEKDISDRMKKLDALRSVEREAKKLTGKT